MRGSVGRAPRLVGESRSLARAARQAREAAGRNASRVPAVLRKRDRRGQFSTNACAAPHVVKCASISVQASVAPTLQPQGHARTERATTAVHFRVDHVSV